MSGIQLLPCINLVPDPCVREHLVDETRENLELVSNWKFRNCARVQGAKDLWFLAAKLESRIITREKNILVIRKLIRLNLPFI